jgi:hypothetical protein
MSKKPASGLPSAQLLIVLNEGQQSENGAFDCRFYIHQKKEYGTSSC